MFDCGLTLTMYKTKVIPPFIQYKFSFIKLLIQCRLLRSIGVGLLLLELNIIMKALFCVTSNIEKRVIYFPRKKARCYVWLFQATN